MDIQTISDIDSNNESSEDFQNEENCKNLFLN